MARFRSAVVVGCALASLVSCSGSSSKITGPAPPLPLPTTAPSKPRSAPVLNVGATVSFETLHGGTPDIAKVTLLSIRWATNAGPDGDPPHNGAYLVMTVRVTCSAGVCDPGAAFFNLSEVDGQAYDTVSPELSGYRPDIGWGLSIQSVDLSTPITAGHTIAGLEVIDAPDTSGVVYLVGGVGTVTAKAPVFDLGVAVAGWKIT